MLGNGECAWSEEQDLRSEVHEGPDCTGSMDTESPSALVPSEMESSDEFWTERQMCFPRIRVGCIVKKSQVSIREGSREPVDEMGELV